MFRKFSSKRLNFFRKFLASEIPWHLLRRKDIHFPHPVGIVISYETEMGKNITIYSNVTIGGKKYGAGKGFPSIKDDVTIYAGACIIGGITIGKGAILGANSTITKDVPAGSIVVNDIKLRFLNDEKK
jgi:serine acetyltransferase